MSSIACSGCAVTRNCTSHMYTTTCVAGAQPGHRHSEATCLPVAGPGRCEAYAPCLAGHTIPWLLPWRPVTSTLKAHTGLNDVSSLKAFSESWQITHTVTPHMPPSSMHGSPEATVWGSSPLLVSPSPRKVEHTPTQGLRSGRWLQLDSGRSLRRGLG